MEFMHFSHNHGLVYHQAIQGYEFHCSGCKSPGSGNVYVCWQCSYFLHEHCFRSERSLKHPSHPLHILTLMPSPTYPSRSFYCNSCSLGGDGFSYSCSECEFDIHVHCALNITIPNPNPNLLRSIVPNPYRAQNNNPVNPPRPIQSNAYPTYPPQNTGYSPNPNHPYPNFTPPNAITPPIPIPQNPPNSIPQRPEKVVFPGHKHTLTLYYSSRAAANREVTFTCDVCMSLIDEMAWVYYCRKCDFGTHLDCVTSAVKQQSASGDGAKSDVVRISEAADEVNAAAIEALFNARGRIAAWGLI